MGQGDTKYPVFRAAARDATGEPILFAIEGESDPFVVQRPVPGLPVMELAADADEMKGRESEKEVLAAFFRFLRGVLGDQFPRFRKAANSAAMSAEDVLTIVRYITQEAAGVPFTPPSVADSPSSEGGQPSKGARSRTAAKPRKR